MKAVLTITAVLVLFLICNTIIYFNKDYTSFFKNKKGILTGFTETVYEKNDSAVKYSLLLKSDKNYEIDGYLRVPVKKDKKYPALILLGGIQTGKKIIDLVGDVSYADSVIFISMDYPYKGKKKFKGLDIFGSLHKIRSAIFNSVSGIMLILDYLHNKHSRQ